MKGIGPKVYEQCAGFLRLRWTPAAGPSSSVPSLPFRPKKRNGHTVVSDQDNDVEMASVAPEEDAGSVTKPITIPRKKRRRRTDEEEPDLDMMLIHATGLPRVEHQTTATNPLDSTWIHPDHYPIATWVIAESGTSLAAFGTEGFRSAIRAWFQSVEDVRLQEILRRFQPDLDRELLLLIVDGLASPEGQEPRPFFLIQCRIH